MEAAIIQLLLNAAGVTALVSTRVYPVDRPQGSNLPVIVVKRIDGAPEYAADGETGLENGRIEVNAYATTYSSTMAIRDAVKAALSGVIDTVVLGVDVKFITVVFESDHRETGTNQSEYLFRRSIDIEVWTKD